MVGTVLTLGVGAAALAVAIRTGWRVPRLWSGLALGLSAYVVVAQVLKLHAHKDYVDLAAWCEILHNIVAGNGAFSSLQDGLVPGTGPWLSVHFTPLLYVFAIPFAVMPTPTTLIVMQFGILSLALVALFAYAADRFGRRDQALIVAAVLGLYPTYQYIHLYEFDMLRFSIPTLLGFLYFVERRRDRLAWVMAALALLVREEVAITVALIGAYLVAFVPERRRFGVVVVALSVAYFVVVTQIVMPALRASSGGEHVAAYWFEPFGRTMLEVPFGVLANPLAALARIAEPVKLANLFMYMLPLMFLPSLGGPILLAALGNVGVNSLSGSITHTTFFLYYLSPTIPILFVGLVRGTVALGQWLPRRVAGRWGNGDGTGAVLVGLFATAIAANLFFGPSPLSLQFWSTDYRLAPFRTQNFHYSQYVVTPRDRELRTILASVPTPARVSAEQHLLPSLFNRGTLRVFPDISDVDYVVIDRYRREKTGVSTVPGSWDGLRRDPQSYYDSVERSPAWEPVVDRSGYAVFARVR